MYMDVDTALSLQNVLSHRRKQESIITTSNGTGNYTLEKDMDRQSSDSKAKSNITESVQHEVNSV